MPFFTSEIWSCPGLYVFKGELFTAIGSPVLRLCCIFYHSHTVVILRVSCCLHFSRALLSFQYQACISLYHIILVRNSSFCNTRLFFFFYGYNLWLGHTKIEKGIKPDHSYLITGNLNFTAKASLETKQNWNKYKTPGSSKLFQTKEACQASAQQSCRFKTLL